MNIFMYNRVIILLGILLLISYSSVVSPPQVAELAEYKAYENLSPKSRSTPIPLPIKGVVIQNEGSVFDIDSIDLHENEALKLYHQPTIRNIMINYFISLTGSEEIALSTLYYADKYKINPFFTFALMYTESNFNPKAKGNNPSSVDRGLFQLNNLSFPLLNDDDFFNVDVNARHGMIHLQWCIGRAKGDLDRALIIYNAGEGRLNSPPASTLAYIQKIRSIQNKFIVNFKQFYFGIQDKNDEGDIEDDEAS